MKKLIAIVLAVTLLASLSGVALAGNNGNGNGAPSGPHYNLNIIGMKYQKNMTPAECGDGHRIFVGLPSDNGNGNGNKSKSQLVTDIYLQMATAQQEADGQGFKVLDCDGTDGRAKFRLPDPNPGGELPCTRYSVFIRVLGKPDGNVKIKTCSEYCDEWTEIDGELVCTGNWYQVCPVNPTLDLTRQTGKGKQKFQNVSWELLTVCVWRCEMVDGVEVCGYERVYLFDDELENYLWKWDNTGGAKLVQLRFYPNETYCVPENGDPWACPPMEQTQLP